MKKFAILALLSMLVMGSIFGQCTITQPAILNPSTLPGGIAKFDLTFKHDRNGGNKWVTIHLWKSTDYPSYDYDRVPTTTRLGGVSKRPFGTVVINNDVVDHSGTYTNAQAFVGAYQNDGNFVMLNTTGSTLVYNASTDSYTLKNLQIILPANTTAIKYDSWSSQSSYNSNVHCFNCNAGTIIVPAVLPVKYSKPFKVAVDEMLEFTWTTSSESNNSHFIVEHLVGSEWKPIYNIFCTSENGYSDTPTDYECHVEKNDSKKQGRSTAVLVGLSVIACALAMRSFVPARLTILLCIVMSCAFGGCEEQKSEESLLEDHWYRLAQVDRDGKITYSDARMVKF